MPNASFNAGTALATGVANQPSKSIPAGSASAVGTAFSLAGGGGGTTVIGDKLAVAFGGGYNALIKVSSGVSAVLGNTEWLPFTLQRPPYGAVEGGDYVRSGTSLPQAALRYDEDRLAPQDIVAQSSLFAQVVSYDTVELTWGWPPSFEGWTHVALVRSCFGHPSTVCDGVTVYARERVAFPSDAEGNPLAVIIKDDGLQGGHWVYYSLFHFNGAEWVQGMVSEALMPRNHKHAEHLWNGVPPYYQFRDNEISPESGPLRKFLQTLGFELDLTREYVESWQETYHVDTSPSALLKQVGANLGFPYEHGLGEIRYRSLLSQLFDLQGRRGTTAGLQKLVESSSKCETLVTTGINMLRLPDDSEFATGPGSWGPLSPHLDAGSSVTGGDGSSAEALATGFNATVNGVLGATQKLATGYIGESRGYGYSPAWKVGETIQAPDTVVQPWWFPQSAMATSGAFNAVWLGSNHALHLTYELLTTGLKEDAGRQGLAVNSIQHEASLDLILSCGAAMGTDPKYTGVAVDEGLVYGFRIWYKGVSGLVPFPGIHWFDKGGTTYDMCGAIQGPSAAWSNDWFALDVQCEAPPGAVYAAPYVKLTGRTAGEALGMSLMGAMFYEVGPSVSVTVYAPEITFVLGDSLLGVEEPAHLNQKLLGV